MQVATVYFATFTQLIRFAVAITYPNTLTANIGFASDERKFHLPLDCVKYFMFSKMNEILIWVRRCAQSVKTGPTWVSHKMAVLHVQSPPPEIRSEMSFEIYSNLFASDTLNFESRKFFFFSSKFKRNFSNKILFNFKRHCVTAMVILFL